MLAEKRICKAVPVEPILPFLSFPLLGGRYKKEVLVDGQSHLLLIREESSLPTAQVRKVFSFSFPRARFKQTVSKIMYSCTCQMLNYIVQQLGRCGYNGV